MAMFFGRAWRSRCLWLLCLLLGANSLLIYRVGNGRGQRVEVRVVDELTPDLMDGGWQSGEVGLLTAFESAGATVCVWLLLGNSYPYRTLRLEGTLHLTKFIVHCNLPS